MEDVELEGAGVTSPSVISSVSSWFKKPGGGGWRSLPPPGRRSGSQMPPDARAMATLASEQLSSLVWLSGYPGIELGRSRIVCVIEVRRPEHRDVDRPHGRFERKAHRDALHCPPRSQVERRTKSNGKNVVRAQGEESSRRIMSKGITPRLAPSGVLQQSAPISPPGASLRAVVVRADDRFGCPLVIRRTIGMATERWYASPGVARELLTPRAASATLTKVRRIGSLVIDLTLPLLPATCVDQVLMDRL